jgi:hypothetical protein
MKIQLVILGTAVLLLAVGLSGCTDFVGGPCSYETYHGKAAIASITQLENSTVMGEKWSDRYQVLFIFELNENQTIKPEQLKLYETVDKEQEFRLGNSWYPNGEYLEKYGIKEGALFDCELKLITEGTCSPWVFDFKNIDESDYLE